MGYSLYFYNLQFPFKLFYLLLLMLIVAVISNVDCGARLCSDMFQLLQSMESLLLYLKCIAPTIQTRSE